MNSLVESRRQPPSSAARAVDPLPQRAEACLATCHVLDLPKRQHLFTLPYGEGEVFAVGADKRVSVSFFFFNTPPGCTKRYDGVPGDATRGTATRVSRRGPEHRLVVTIDLNGQSPRVIGTPRHFEYDMNGEIDRGPYLRP